MSLYPDLAAGRVLHQIAAKVQAVNGWNRAGKMPSPGLQVRCACTDIDLPRRRLQALEGDVERRWRNTRVGKLLTSCLANRLEAAC